MLKLAVMGATGAVGREILKVLEQRDFAFDSIKLLASRRSKGMELEAFGRRLVVEELTEDSFAGVDMVLASAGGSISKKFAPHCVNAGAVIIDNTSAFRMEPGVPLVVPEVNPEAARLHQGIIANPNCSTIQLVVALAPLHRAAAIKRIIVSTYQSTSGAGEGAMRELLEQSRAILDGATEVACEQFPHQIAFNCLPQIGSFEDNGYTTEEMKMVNETRKILDDSSIGISATTVRVPVLRSHAEAINIETEQLLTPDRARELLAQAPGVCVLDDPANNQYPLPVQADGEDATYVGRIRQDISNENGLDLWVVSDNLRKGAALNAVQIAELLIERDWLKPTST